MAPTTAIKKCTVCKNPTKGHVGRAGKGNCTMKPMEDDEDVSSLGKKNIVEVLAPQRTEVVEEAIKEDVGAEPWEDVSTSPLPCEQPAHMALKRTKNEAKRIHSKSDGKVDIREYVAGKRFVMCTCMVEGGSISPCECEGVLVVGEDLKNGAKITNFPLVRDPLAMKNLKVVLTLDAADGWSSEQQNVLNFKPSVSSKGIVVEGDVKLEMKRAVELVKGRRKLSVLWQLTCTDVRIGYMAARFVEKDIVSPENVADVTCRLWEMVEQTPGMWSPRPPGAEEDVFHGEEDSLEEGEDEDESVDEIGEMSGEVKEMSTDEESDKEKDEDSEAASETLEETEESDEE